MLTIHQRFKRAVIAAAIGGLSALVVLPVTSYAADTLRPDVAKPLNAAQDLYRAHKYKDALTKIDQADAVPGKTAYERQWQPVNPVWLPRPTKPCWVQGA